MFDSEDNNMNRFMELQIMKHLGHYRIRCSAQETFWLEDFMKTVMDIHDFKIELEYPSFIILFDEPREDFLLEFWILRKEYMLLGKMNGSQKIHQ